MPRAQLILDRYEPIGTAGSGGFGTVQIAWDPRIQRKVAIKTIQLTEQDAYRAALPGAQAVSPDGRMDFEDQSSGSPDVAPSDATADRWHGLQPWDEFLAEEGIESDSGVLTSQDVFEPETFHALANLPGLDEARTAAMLSDPRIVTVYDFEVRGRMAYLIMEYVGGATLTQIMRDYADWLTLDVVAAVFDAVAGALTAAHEAGVLHLDIKPDNILVNAKGEVKVTDFGLATLADASGAGTTGGGTIGYMPLEQMRREHLDARTDEWSLASVTYEMLTGENPFLAKGLDEAEAAIEDAELVLPSLCWQGVDEQIDDVMFYALDPDRDERYASVSDFAEEAEKFLGDVAAGKAQLAAIVEDALAAAEELDDEQAPDEFDVVEVQKGPGALGFLKSFFGRNDRDADTENRIESRNATPLALPEADRFDAADEDEEESQDDWDVRQQRARKPLRDKLSARALGVLARVFAALASWAVGFLAAANFTVLEAFGPGQAYVAVAIAIAAAALAIVRPHLGALVSFALLAVALAMKGAVLPAIVLLAALVAWWYFIARKSVASSNVALASPILGAVWGTSITPLLAGMTLKPLHAVATSAFGVVCALVLGSLGTGSMFGWDAASHWLISGADVTTRFVSLVTKSSTWLVAAGWLASSLVQSLLSLRRKRWMEIVGLVLSVAIMAIAAMVLTGFSIPATVSLAIGFVVLLAVIV